MSSIWFQRLSFQSIVSYDPPTESENHILEKSFLNVPIIPPYWLRILPNVTESLENYCSLLLQKDFINIL